MWDIYIEREGGMNQKVLYERKRERELYDFISNSDVDSNGIYFK